MANKIIETMFCEIDINEFTEKAQQHNVNGKMFIKGEPTFKNSLKFAKIFCKITGYDKKKFKQIYDVIKKWNPTNHLATTQSHVQQIKISNNAKLEEKKVEDNSFPEEKKMERDESNTDVYEFGTRFYYWNCMKDHKHSRGAMQPPYEPP
eukprot:106986_1